MAVGQMLSETRFLSKIFYITIHLHMGKQRIVLLNVGINILDLGLP